jgi:hypothetical protein
MTRLRPSRPAVVRGPVLAVCAGVAAASLVAAPAAVPAVPPGATPTAGPAPAGTASGAYQTAELTFTESAPGRPSGLRLRIDYRNPDDPAAKPPAVRRVVQVLARGARVDTGAPARCTASDAELILLGRSACPAGSVVGHGFIRLDTGFPRPGRYLREDVTFLNDTHQLIFLTRDRQTGARAVTRARVEGRRVVSEAPLLPGTPPDGAAVDVVRAELPRLVRMRDGTTRSYVTTPGHCPDRGYWLNRIHFAYRDGTHQSERTRVPCDR